MCSPIRCKSCGKTTWSGCGEHIAQVKATIPADQWCAGHPDADGNNGRRRRLFGRSG